MHIKGAISAVAAALALISAALLGACPAMAGPASAENEASYLAKIHEYAAGQGVSGSDSEYLSDGYYSCHLQALGEPPPAFGISPLVTTYAIEYLCEEYANS